MVVRVRVCFWSPKAEEAIAAANAALRVARKTPARWEARLVLARLALDQQEPQAAEKAFEAAIAEARQGGLPALELLAVQELSRTVLGPAGCQAEGERRLEEVAKARLKKPLSVFSGSLLAEPAP